MARIDREALQNKLNRGRDVLGAVDNLDTVVDGTIEGDQILGNASIRFRRRNELILRDGELLLSSSSAKSILLDNSVLVVNTRYSDSTSYVASHIESGSVSNLNNLNLRSNESTSTIRSDSGGIITGQTADCVQIQECVRGRESSILRIVEALDEVTLLVNSVGRIRSGLDGSGVELSQSIEDSALIGFLKRLSYSNLDSVNYDSVNLKSHSIFLLF